MINEITKRIPLPRILLLVTGTLLYLSSLSISLADNVQPAYLDVEEIASGSIRVVWKVPTNQNLPVPFKPSFPESFKVASPQKRLKTPDAVITKWTMVCGETGLAGSIIGIDGLEKTALEVLVRIQLADGTLHRSILRPTEKITKVPVSVSTASEQRGTVQFAYQMAGRWHYALVFLAGWLLSLTPDARRRGIVFCTISLIAGSLCGDAIGRISVFDRQFGHTELSDTEAKRIVRGLVLNTYRAFILDNDEDIYDVLARSVAGEFLSEVYLQNKEAMRINAADGTMSIIDRLDVKSIESQRRLKNGAITLVADWDVYGSVRHLNHIHFRCNTYKAELTIVPSDRYWKLTNVQLLEEERVM
jgi:hypothetical protein